MKQQQFEAKYHYEWQEFESQLELLESKKTADTDLTLFAKNYRKICYYLALAQERRYSPDIITRLNGIALRGHQQLYQHKSNVLHNMLTFIISGFPQQIRKHAKLIGFASALFYGPALIFGLLVYFNPSLMFSFQSPRPSGRPRLHVQPRQQRRICRIERFRAGSCHVWILYSK